MLESRAATGRYSARCKRHERYEPFFHQVFPALTVRAKWPPDYAVFPRGTNYLMSQIHVHRYEFLHGGTKSGYVVNGAFNQPFVPTSRPRNFRLEDAPHETPLFCPNPAADFA